MNVKIHLRIRVEVKNDWNGPKEKAKKKWMRFVYFLDLPKKLSISFAEQTEKDMKFNECHNFISC